MAVRGAGETRTLRQRSGIDALRLPMLGGGRRSIRTDTGGRASKASRDCEGCNAPTMLCRRPQRWDAFQPMPGWLAGGCLREGASGSWVVPQCIPTVTATRPHHTKLRTTSKGAGGTLEYSDGDEEVAAMCCDVGSSLHAHAQNMAKPKHCSCRNLFFKSILVKLPCHRPSQRLTQMTQMAYWYKYKGKGRIPSA